MFAVNNQGEEIKDRIQWLDLAKGIVILLVIVGHTVWGGVRAAIFSFHMPLFFILSGVTFKYSVNGDVFLENIKKNFKHLIIPALLIFGIKTMIELINNIGNFHNWNNMKNFFTKRILMLLFSSGVDVKVLNFDIEAIGMVWFLIVLFGSKMLFDYINLYHSSKSILCYFILSVAGIVIGKLQWLPLSFDISLAIQPFLFIGYNYKSFHVESKPCSKFIFFSLVWFVLLCVIYFVTGSYLELAGRRYPLYPLCYIVAVLGTLVVVEFCVAVANWHMLRPIIFLGKNSLYMLCVHAMDYLYIGAWKFTTNDFINAMCRVVIDVIVFIIWVLIMHGIKNINKSRIDINMKNRENTNG